MYSVSAWFSHKVQLVRLSVCESVSVCYLTCVLHVSMCIFVGLCVCEHLSVCVFVHMCTQDHRVQTENSRRDRHGYHSPSSFFNESGSIWQAQDWRKWSPLHLWMAKLARAVGEQMVAISEEWISAYIQSFFQKKHRRNL